MKIGDLPGYPPPRQQMCKHFTDFHILRDSIGCTPRCNLKYHIFRLVDIVVLCTISNLSSNQNEAYIGCRLKQQTLTWPILHKLEQLERLRSEDTPHRPMITHTMDQFVLNPKSILLTSSYQIPSQNKVKA